MADTRLRVRYPSEWKQLLRENGEILDTLFPGIPWRLRGTRLHALCIAELKSRHIQEWTRYREQAKAETEKNQ